MEKPFEDSITQKIKEVMEHYEPEYSPQAWEKLRKLIPVPDFWLKKLFLKYKFWLSDIAIVGVLVAVYEFTTIHPAGNNSVIDPLFSESVNYFVPEKGIEKEFTGNTAPYKNLTQEGKPITEIPESIGRASVIPVSFERTGFGYKYNTTQLIPIENGAADIKLLKDRSYKKSKKLEFHWPSFNSSLTKEGDFGKFVGPDKLVFFYSPEIHYSDSLGNIGVSQGIGINFEGRIRSLVSISAGLSYQSINFNKTISSEKVPPHDLVLQPSDTNRIFYYVDSTEIRSGSYRFLELPVAVNFKFIESARSQVWLGAGFSSIAFLGQEYTYETIVEEVSESSSISVKAWENIHPLASINFSLLLRYNVSDQTLLHGSIQYKQHLVPLGYNSMKLNRLNFQVGIIYCFGRGD